VKLQVKIGGKTRDVEVSRKGGESRWLLDGRAMDVDAVEVETGAYSILLEGKAYEVHVEPAADGLRIHVGDEEFTAAIVDPREWQGRHGHAVEVEGRLQILAPMSGKIVRVLVKQGDPVQAGQGIVVVEAMKMQNEVKSRKTGTVERVMASEGTTVNAGEILAVVA
jgi:biotin carboxyl carrier protein